MSRPQIYYSLDKLTRLRLIRIAAEDTASAGLERRVFEGKTLGRERLADALESSRSVHQPFLIWLALSWQARPHTLAKQLNRRKSSSAIDASSSPRLETGVRLAICDSLSLTTVVLLNELGASALESQNRKPDRGFVIGYSGKSNNRS